MKCTDDDFDNIWNVATKLNLTYCIGPFEDEALQDVVVKTLTEAVAQFERAADVNYIEVRFADPLECQTAWAQGDVLYIIREAVNCSEPVTPTEGDIDAECDCGAATDIFTCDFSAFGTFPSSDGGPTQPMRARVVFTTKALNPDQFDGAAQVVVHELGHTLGLYHEHARWEQDQTDPGNLGLCAPQSGLSWRALTPPDPSSIMGYGPPCDDSVANVAPRLSALDRQGLHYLYTLPRTGPLHFDDGATDDILWVQPGSNAMSVWFGGADGNGDISFTPQPFIAPLDGTLVSRRVKPIPIRIADDPLSHILLYAPGDPADDFGVVQEDNVLAPEPGDALPFSVSDYVREQQERYAFPIVGRFLGAANDEVWWVLPGPDGVRTDAMWAFNPMTQTIEESQAYDASFSADNYRRLLTGIFAPGVGSGLPDSQVVSWREEGAAG
ncbi:MAG TPA: M12 family metallopeptidase, partial [Polyangiaceae bacterium]|nr:M12 family metallopeptidase [Polyangiaceae bacterium]